MELKVFNKWDTNNIQIADKGLAGYINLTPQIVPRKSHGRHASHQFYKSQVNIVERLMNHLFVPGHKGKKHKISSYNTTGQSITNYNNIKKCFEILETKTKKNPIEVLVKAIENAAVREEVTSYRVGSIMARKAVITSPQRRVDLALRYMVQGAYRKAIGSKKTMAGTLSEEILLTFNADKQSFAMQEKDRLEREAEGAR